MKRTLMFVCVSKAQAEAKKARLAEDGYTVQTEIPETNFVNLKTFGFSEEQSQETSIFKNGQSLWIVQGTK